MTKLYPNTFQHPNLYIDDLAYFLTPQENTVLAKAVREILGWKDNEVVTKRIALSVFVEGKFKEDMPKTEENRLAYGCGLSRAATIKALEALDSFGVLVKTGPASHPHGQAYTLQFEADKIDWDSLRQRKESRRKSNTKRTRKATKARSGELVTSDVTSNVGRTSTSNVGRTQRNPKKPIRNPITTPPIRASTSDVTSSDSGNSVVVGLENELRRLNKYLDEPIYLNRLTKKLSPELVGKWATCFENGGEVIPTKALISIIESGQAPPDLPQKVEYVPVEDFEL